MCPPPLLPMRTSIIERNFFSGVTRDPSTIAQAAHKPEILSVP
jgi:hypothetical protein